MNVFVPDKAKVRVFIDSNGIPLCAKNNIGLDLEVEVVEVSGERKSIEAANEKLDGSLPFDTDTSFLIFT